VRAARAEYHAGLALAEQAAAQPGSDPRWQQIISDMRKTLASMGEREGKM